LRHHYLTQLAYGPIAQRRFAEWSIGFRALVPIQMRQVRGYVELEQLPVASFSLNGQDALLVYLLQGFVHTCVEVARGGRW
jgi:hypothetical protein